MKAHRARPLLALAHYYAGISLKTQQLYLLVFVTRYLDLPWNVLHLTLFSLYLAVMKIIYIGATFTVVYLMMTRYKRTYNKDDDWLPLYVVIPPCALLALVWNEGYSPFEVRFIPSKLSYNLCPWLWCA